MGVSVVGVSVGVEGVSVGVMGVSVGAVGVGEDSQLTLMVSSLPRLPCTLEATQVYTPSADLSAHPDIDPTSSHTLTRQHTHTLTQRHHTH